MADVACSLWGRPTGRGVPRAVVALLAGLAALLPACGRAPERTPAAAEREAPPRPRDPVLTSEDVDRQVGAETAERIAQELGLLPDSDLVRYVTDVGRELVPHATGRRFDYQFNVVDEETPNAFTLPGGQIYVSRGLLALTNSADELANVLGHEITHAAARHAAGRQQLAARARNPLMLPGVLLGAVLGDGVGEALSAPFRAFNAAYLASYSRDQERAADRGGQTLAARAGYDPRGMAEFLRGLDGLERLRLGHSRMPGYYDTHPTTAERVASAASNAGLTRWRRPTAGDDAALPDVAAGPAGRADDPAAYLERLDGLLLGTSPAEGLFQDALFLHPDLDFALRFPAGWRLVNADTYVGAVSPEREAQIMLAAPERGDDPRAAAQAFLRDNLRELGLRVQREHALRIGRLPAYRVEAAGRMGQTRVEGEATWIAYDGLIYRVSGLARVPQGRRYGGRARSTARSFRPLTADQRAGIRETRLRVARARAGESLVQLGERTGNTWNVHVTAVMNGLQVGAPLAEGQRIKVALEQPYEDAER